MTSGPLFTGTVLVCSPVTHEPGVRAVMGSFVKVLRRAAPGLEVRDVPVDHLPDDWGHHAFAGESAPYPRVAVPLSLSDREPVAQTLAAERRRDPDLVVSHALGPDWLLAELGVRRLVDAGAHHGDTIVLGVAGSDDPGVIADYSRAAQLLSAVWGGPVHIGSLSGSDTLISDAIDIARAYGKRVVVSSYVLTPGATADELRASGADLVTAPILDGASPDRRLVRLVLERCQQALGALAPAVGLP
ncbi:MAG: sirohydrochlorin chelatase [Aeromicrobium sp.]